MSEGFRHIVRICGTDIDGTRKIAYGLRIIKGVGINFAKAVVDAAKMSHDIRIGALSDEDIRQLETIISSPDKHGIPTFLYNRQNDLKTGMEKHLYGADLTLRTKLDIDSLKEIKCWRGVRHSLGLKVRGQKTRTTGRTGKAVGVKKKAVISMQQKQGQ